MPLALVLAQLAAPDLVAAARARTAAATRCPETNTTDVTVCGRRNADRFRVPMVERTALPSRDADPGGRVAMLHRTNPVQDMGPFLVGGGFAGVSAGTSFGSGAKSGPKVSGARPFAP